MIFLVVDDERISLRSTERILTRLYPEAEVLSADNYMDALELVKRKPAVAFLDVEMPGMTGLELAERLQKINPRINIIFATAYDDFARNAYMLHASGYLTKPFAASDILKEMEHLRYPLEPEPVQIEVETAPSKEAFPVEQNPLHFQCFGNFEVFFGDKPMHFQRRRSKEILAYLIHLRGASANRQEISSVMWESAEEIDRKKDYFRILVASLRKTLKEYDVEDLLICTRDSFAVNIAKVNCDYYLYLRGDKQPQNQYRGEYMLQYSWAEETNARLYDRVYYNV